MVSPLRVIEVENHLSLCNGNYYVARKPTDKDFLDFPGFDGFELREFYYDCALTE
jgi:hypothetical protein